MSPSPTNIRHELGALISLAAPLAAVQAGQQLMSVVDVAVVGRLGATELAAMGLANALWGAFYIVGLGVMLGFDPLTAQALGAGRQGHARHLMWQSLWMGAFVSLILAVPLVGVTYALVPAGIDPTTAEKARAVILIRLPSLLPLMIFVGVRSYLQAMGITRPMVLGMVGANVFNLFAAIVLTFGGSILPTWTGPLTGIPAMGLSGAALASSLCVVVQLVAVIVAVRAVHVREFTSGMRRMVPAEMGRALKVGLPISLQMGAEVGLFSLVGVLAGRLGTLDLAAHQVAISIASFSFCVAVGLGNAGSVRVGLAIGAKDAHATRIRGIVSFIFGASFMAVSAVVLWVAPDLLARLFSDQGDVVAATASLLFVAAVFQISDGVQAVGAGVLRGAGDTRFLSVANVVGHYAIGLPVAILLGFILDGGIRGLWWGLCSGLSAVALALFVRFWMLSQRPIRPLHEHHAA
ncbi:MAG: MATE family efflux transporter [Myxococcota bacterium]